MSSNLHVFLWVDGKRLQACLKRLELQVKTKSKTLAAVRGWVFRVFRVQLTYGNARVYMGKAKRDGIYMVAGTGFERVYMLCEPWSWVTWWKHG